MTADANVIGVTGPRSLTPDHRAVIKTVMRPLMAESERLLVGDAWGVDALCADLGRACYLSVIEYKVGQSGLSYSAPLAAHLQARSKNLVEGLAVMGGILHGWPNSYCPPGLTVSSWKGSGTWGTMRYAVAMGVPLVVHTEIMPGGFELPSWTNQEQLKLT
jgi:hypothetical protein